MSANQRSKWLRWSALLALFMVSTAAVATAQTPPPSLEGAVTPGMTVWITDAAGNERKGRIVAVAAGVVTTALNGEVWQFNANDVTRVERRASDSLLNGALIGAGAAVASGLFLCTRAEPWENCRDDVGPILSIGAIGAAIGVGIDALIGTRRTIYEATRTPTSFRAAPLLGPGATGLRFSLTF